MREDSLCVYLCCGSFLGRESVIYLIFAAICWIIIVQVPAARVCNVIWSSWVEDIETGAVVLTSSLSIPLHKVLVRTGSAVHQMQKLLLDQYPRSYQGVFPLKDIPLLSIAALAALHHNLVICEGFTTWQESDWGLT